MPRSKKRKKTSQRQARQARLEQQRAEDKKLTPEQYMRRRAFGWGLVGLAVLVGVSHWLAHVFGFPYQDSARWDLTLGYPTAAALAIAGSVALSKT